MEADLLGGDFQAAPAPVPSADDPFAPQAPSTPQVAAEDPFAASQQPEEPSPPATTDTPVVVQGNSNEAQEPQPPTPTEPAADNAGFDAFAAPAAVATSDTDTTSTPPESGDKAIRTSAKDGVAGVVVAGSQAFNHVAGFPKETEMADTVLPLPDLVQNNVLCPDTLPRLQEPGFLVKLSVEHEKKKKLLSRHDSFVVKDAMGNPFHGIVAMEEHTKVGRSNRIVFYDDTKQPIMLARQKRNINKKYLILGRSKLLKGDIAEEHEDGVPFYPWFMIRDIDDSHLKFRSVQVWNGNNYQPYLQIRPAKNPAKGQPGGKLRIPSKNDLRLTGSDDHERNYGLFSKKSVENEGGERVSGWDFAVAPGADVALCLALAVVLDDMVGWLA